MEVQNGFILGVYNYCDGWCERCALTSRARDFIRAGLDEPEAVAALRAALEERS